MIRMINCCQPVEGTTQGNNGNYKLGKETAGCVHCHPTRVSSFPFHFLIGWRIWNQYIFLFSSFQLSLHIGDKNLVIVWSPSVAIAINFSRATWTQELMKRKTKQNMLINGFKHRDKYNSLKGDGDGWDADK